MRSSWKRLSLKVIITITAGALVLMLLVTILLLYVLRKKCRKAGTPPKSNGFAPARDENPREDYSSGVQAIEGKKLVFFEGYSYNFDLDDLLRASAEVLGKSPYGTTYKAVLEDGTTVVVKRLKEMGLGKREFEQRMEIMLKLGKHPQVAPPRAYYFSKDDKLVVYDYIPAASLSAVLHGEGETGRPRLEWGTRLRIALAVAHGLAHIHGGRSGRLVHGSVKSSNVLLIPELDACVTDFGLAPIMGAPPSPGWAAQGHHAPETVHSGNFTQKSDVYGFGVVLLEMLTGKAPLQSLAYGDVVDLPRWVQSVVREEWTAEVFDVELMRHGNEEELLRVLQIAMACVAGAPDQRPSIEEVIRMIQDVQLSDLELWPSSEDTFKDFHVQTPGKRLP